MAPCCLRLLSILQEFIYQFSVSIGLVLLAFYLDRGRAFLTPPGIYISITRYSLSNGTGVASLNQGSKSWRLMSSELLVSIGHNPTFR